MTVFEQLLDRQVTYIAEFPPQRKDAIMLEAHVAEAFNSVNGSARAVQIEWVWSPTTMPESSALRATTWRDDVRGEGQRASPPRADPLWSPQQPMRKRIGSRNTTRFADSCDGRAIAEDGFLLLAFCAAEEDNIALVHLRSGSWCIRKLKSRFAWTTHERQGVRKTQDYTGELPVAP